MPPLEKKSASNTPWRSLAELENVPEFRAWLEAEFPPAADRRAVSRRRWLQLMGASLALAGIGGCRWEQEEILPFVERPANRVPGKPERYATAMDLAGSAIGLLVTSLDGRPIKVEGNPGHPQSRGATDAFAQAAVLELYDPDRSRNVWQATPQGEIAHRGWAQFDAFAREHFGRLNKTGGSGFRVLSEASSSPTLARLKAELLQAFPEARCYEYEAISRDNERDGARLAFGKPYRTHYALDRANVVVCVDADLFGSHPAAVQYARDFANARDADAGRMNRLYVVESRCSITGAAADHRLPLRSAQLAAYAALLEREVTTLLEHPEEDEEARQQRRQALIVDAALEDILSVLLGLLGREIRRESGSEPAESPPQKPQETWQLRHAFAAADELAANPGQAIVAVGPCQPAGLHALAHRLNALLGNARRTVHYLADPDPGRPSHVEAIKSLVEEMGAGKVDTLLVLGGNPVYNAPADLAFAEAFEKVPTSIHLSSYRNETSLASTWHLPQAHFLESWSDARSWDGTYSIVQPVIEPLWGARPAIELLALLSGSDEPGGCGLVRHTFRQLTGENEFETRWRRTLHDGLLAKSQWTPQSPKVSGAAQLPEVTIDRSPGESTSRETLEIVFCQDASAYDGRFANNGWLQETPDPMTRLTWDNAAVMSPETARALGVANEDLVRLRFDGRELEIPVLILPGQASGSIAVSLGYGRIAAGHVGGSETLGVASVGFDTYRLRSSRAMSFALGVTVEATGRSYRLAVTQDHHATDAIGLAGRAERLGELVREATLDQYKEDPHLAEHAAHLPGGAAEEGLKSLWEEHSYDGHRWGMAIDLSKCIGCNACVLACQAENNVPIVGKERVLEGREMHWIRVDRYFRGNPEGEDLAVSFQPVMCHHCENAPCEQVCPVAATVHSKEGLNDMVYNRCVGTRYCANNCPYKVRRFNYFNYHKDLNDPGNGPIKMVYNPEVTVRSRGVMEKCTYCVQRVQAAKISASKIDAVRREIPDGRIRTACQEACPTRAIEFGDLSDPQSRVRRAHDAVRAYGMLAELNVKPRTKYLVRIRNPNPALLTLARPINARRTTGAGICRENAGSTRSSLT